MSLRLVLMSVRAESSIERFRGFLPQLLNNGERDAITAIYSGEDVNVASATREKLLAHQVVEEIEGKLYSRLPLLTLDYSEKIVSELADVTSEIGELTRDCLKEIAKKLESQWNDLAHAMVGQVIVNGIWYRLWSKMRELPNESSVIFIANPNLVKAFYTGVLSARENDAITYWQTSIQKSPDDIQKRLNHRDAVATLQSMDENDVVVVKGEALVQMGALKMYRTKSESSGAVTCISLPVITDHTLRRVMQELKELGRSFYQIADKLETRAKSLFAKRPDKLRAVEYGDFRHLVYLVFSYCVVQLWQESELLPQLFHVKNAGKKNEAIMTLLN